MDISLLETLEFTGEGFMPLIVFGAWRVAFLRYLETLNPERIDSMERHTETDEVFVLLNGRGVPILGGNGEQVNGIYPQEMETGKLYNVKRNAWHTILLSRDAKVLLVENGDTGEQNSEIIGIPAGLPSQIMDLAQRELLRMQS